VNNIIPFRDQSGQKETNRIDGIFAPKPASISRLPPSQHGRKKRPTGNSGWPDHTKPATRGGMDRRQAPACSRAVRTGRPGRGSVAKTAC